MDLSFDIRGNLKPYQKNSLSLKEFKTYFVDTFDDIDQKRRQIWENYETFLKDFQLEVTPTFTQWIDGSFVSTKSHPSDIDFVTLIDYTIYEKYEKLIEEKFRMQHAKNYYKFIDAYTIKIYPENHQKHFITEYDLLYWERWFMETKKNRNKMRFPKGFIEIKFE